jgi:hypothetical protein
VLAISPRFDESKLAAGLLEDKIDVFEDQVLGWLVTPAKMMGTSQHSGFALLAVALAYFEPLGQFLEGKSGKSGAQFTLGVKAVFPAMAGADPILFSELYDQLRCGMFHRGITKGKVRVARGTQYPLAIVRSATQVTEITVDPWRLLAAVELHVKEYANQLRNRSNTALRQNFERWFDLRAA